jgi:hypothetical protein
MHKGSCLCGAVSFEVTGNLPPPDPCHCSQCRGLLWFSERGPPAPATLRAARSSAPSGVPAGLGARRVQASAAAAASHLITSTDVATALSALFNIGSKEKDCSSSWGCSMMDEHF